MVAKRSRVPWFIPLLVIAALSVGVWWRDSLVFHSSNVDLPPGGEMPGTGAGNFGPIPLGRMALGAGAGGEAPVVSEEMERLAARMSRQTDGLVVVTHPDGRRSVSLEGRFHHMSAVVSRAGGKREIQCFTDFNEMTSALPGSPSDPSRPPVTHER